VDRGARQRLEQNAGWTRGARAGPNGRDSDPVVLPPWTRSGRTRWQAVLVTSARPVDPRDQSCEVYDPMYRVHFWDVEGRSDEWELSGCDVQEALQWAHDSAQGRIVTLYAAVGSQGLGLIRLLGADPHHTEPAL
jgi:hypothetical protein